MLLLLLLVVVLLAFFLQLEKQTQNRVRSGTLSTRGLKFSRLRAHGAPGGVVS